MTERHDRDLMMLLELQSAGNERVQTLLAAYEELAEEEKALFRLAASLPAQVQVARLQHGDGCRADGRSGKHEA